MRKIETETEKYKIVASETFITFKDQVSTVILDGEDEGTDNPFYIEFITKIEGENIEIQQDVLQDERKGIFFTIKMPQSAINFSDSGLVRPVRIAQSTKVVDGKNSTHFYHMNLWFKKLGESFSITYSIYKDKEPTIEDIIPE